MNLTDIEFRSDFTVELIDHMGDDDAIIRAMLVSTMGSEALEQEATFGRINFLMKNRHGTPFEHASMTFYAEVPIFVMREWHRHRIGVSYNEMSGRYTQLPPTYYIPPEHRQLIQQGKPGQYTFVPGTPTQWRYLRDAMEYEAKDNYRHYEMRLAGGIAKEVARMSLGINIYTAQFFTCNPRSMMAFLSLRTKDAGSKFPSFPMWEIEQVAHQMESLFASLFPMTYQAFCENGRVAP